MTTITIKIDTNNKSSESFIEFLKTLPFVKIEDIEMPAKSQKLLDDFKKSIPAVVKQAKSKKKGKSLQSLIDEL